MKRVDSQANDFVVAIRCEMATGKEEKPPELLPTAFVLSGSAGRTRTYNPSVNSRMLCH